MNENDDSVNIISLFQAVKKRWLMIVLIVCLSLIAAFLITLGLPASYTAVGYLKIGVVADRPIETPILLKSYLDTPENLKIIADRVGLDYSEVVSNVKAELIQNLDRERTVMHVLKVSAKANNPEKAALMVDTAMSILENYTNSRYKLWETSFGKELDRIYKTTDQMIALMNGFLSQSGEGKQAGSWFSGTKPTDQFTAEAQGLAVGNGMLAQADILRLESEWVAAMDQKTEETNRRVNPIPPPDPDPGLRLLIMGSVLVVSLVVALGLATYLYSQDRALSKAK